MRIAFLTHQWPGIRMGGIGTCVRQTAAAMACAGHDVHVFTLAIPDELRTSTPKGVHLHEVPDLATRTHCGALAPELAASISAGGEGVYRLSVGWLLSAALLEEHRASPFDIVEAPDVEALGLPLMLQPDFAPPVVTHLHCCTAIAQAANGVEVREAERLINALEFAAIQLSDECCAPTKAVIDRTAQFTPLRKAIATIPHPYACDDDIFVPPPANGPMIFVGRIERLKGVVAIAKALNIVLPQLPKATFRFIGPDTSSAPGGGSMRDYLRSILSPDIADRVVFAGELDPHEVQAELRRCSFCVLPSISENFSMACCEALAAGRTAIVGEATGSVELMGDAGIAVASESALAIEMQRLLTDRASLERLSRRAHAKIRTDFNPSRIAAKRTHFYAQAIKHFDQRGNTSRNEKLNSLSSDCAAALLPALVNMTGVLAGVHRPPRSPGARLLQIMERLSQQTSRPAVVRLYGAGKHTARLMSERHVWEARGHRVVSLIDDHPRFARSSTYLDLPVHSMQHAIATAHLTDPASPIVLSTDTYQDQFWAQTQPLRDKGIAVFRLY